ncbi:hypothetical protein N7516_008101 [Penicillium verrucosum]|uniref:uncharacterized protein n=1 Tax=Penicillium verrucosum TaxID=60171 RepID=UPI0025457523|nr:uncharacterized protein N7516_008101 [Penicillium verrucosum]KAJ5926328.1 hypothetical protein N7516_008101 [Penicillium verrucosum]
MSYFKTEYQRFLDNPRSAKLADDVSMIYVPTTTKFEQADNVITHVLKNAKVVKTKSNQVISAIEGSDSLCLDMETTLEFTEGGGVYLPSMDDNFLADRVATFPTVHIVHFDADKQIKQIRIYWDQASLLKQVEVIGARGRQWPVRDGKDQLRLLKTAETARLAPSQPASQDSETKLPNRPSSPGKRRIRDPYSADSLTELLSPSKETSKPASSKKYTQDPYGAGSLNEILSPTKKAPAYVPPFAPSSGRPATRNFSDIFVKDDHLPDSPSKPQRRAAPVDEEDGKAAKGPVDEDRNFYRTDPRKYSHFEIGEENAAGKGPVDEDRHFYKTAPGKYNHFEIGGDNSEREAKGEVKQANTKHATHWDFDDVETPVKASRAPRGQERRHFGFGDNEDGDGSPKASQMWSSPVATQTLTDEESGDDGRVISSFAGRGKRLYENRLFDDEDQPPTSDKENKPAQKHDAHNKMMESHWDKYDEQSPCRLPKNTPRTIR